MWTRVTAERDELMLRYIVLFGSLQLYGRAGTRKSAVNRARSSLSAERIILYHYQGDSFDAALRFRLDRRNNRYLVCMAFLGDVAPQEVLDLVYEKTQEFMEDKGLLELYAEQPRSVDYPPMQVFYDLAATDPRFEETIVAEMPAATMLRIVLVPTQ
jgi:hypothetical protein